MGAMKFPRISTLVLTAAAALHWSRGFAAAQGYTVLHYLATDASEGMQPQTELVELGGNFYGICWAGGQYSNGTAFKITPGGTFTKIHDFDFTVDGSTPLALVDGGDGNLYGLLEGYASDPGNPLTFQPGVFFKMTTAGTVTVLHLFAHDGSEGGLGPAFLMLGSDGNFYGTSWTDGANGYGTVYRLSNGGGYAKLHDFGPFGDAGGSSPNSLIEVSPGVLFGTTLGGGANNYGTVFQLAESGSSFSVVHSFATSEGGLPGGGYTAPPLVLATDGRVYGTTAEGGAYDQGSVWGISTAGDFSVLHQFHTTAEGFLSYAGIFEASDGTLYGATSGGTGDGLLYQVTLSGSETPFHAFDPSGADGAAPYSGPIQGSDGKLYGATYGGNSGVGVIYQHTLPPSVQSLNPTSGPSTGSTAMAIMGTSFASGATVTVGSVGATGVGFVSATQLQATTPALSPGTLNDVTVTNPDTVIGTLQGGFLADFLDVAQTDLFHAYVEKVFRHGITAGCGGGNYCRNNPVTRAQMAVFLLKGKHGSTFIPPNCTGIFPDVPCTPGFGFPDWIEELANEGITGGCGGGNYCPTNPVTRQQMAVFLLKTEHGSGYVPPACTGIFGDVPCPSQFADWIERLYAEAVTGGCQVSPPLYCPASSVLRGQMAAFLTKTFNLP